jgi:hypothetical protein
LFPPSQLISRLLGPSVTPPPCGEQ